MSKILSKNCKWIRIEGKLIPDDRMEAKKDMLDKNPELRGMYSEFDDNTEYMVIDSLNKKYIKTKIRPLGVWCEQR